MADSEKKHAACKECRGKKLKCVPSERGGDSCHRYVDDKYRDARVPLLTTLPPQMREAGQGLPAAGSHSAEAQSPVYGIPGNVTAALD
jgi:hypothetical protein